SSGVGSIPADFSSGGSMDGEVFENNILGGTGTSHSMLAGPASGGSVITNRFNYDMMDSTTASVAILASWNGADKTKAGLVALGPWETDGLQHTRAFADSTVFNYSLGPYTFFLNKARRITGVNTG